MTCYIPIEGYRHPNGKVTHRRTGSIGLAVVPCGQCIGCRIEHAQGWAARCVHEAQMHQANSFLTLTYDNEHLPHGGVLHPPHTQNFMKELRRTIPAKVRFYLCGEYGSETRRPHYHVLLFGYDFPDKELWKKSGSGEKLYRSDQLEKVWRKGHSYIGDMNYKTAGYCARYSMKKIRGEKADEHYESIIEDTGEIIQLTPEFQRSSNRPGIGYDFFQRYYRDIYPSDFVVVQGKKQRPPKYYDQLLKAKDNDLYQQVLKKRRENLDADHPDMQRERLDARHTCQKIKAERLTRSL